MRCSSCGTENGDGQANCTNCGRPIATPEKQATKQRYPEGLRGATCFICKTGTLINTKKLFFASDSLLECNNCHTKYQSENGKYILKEIPLGNPLWRTHEDTPLAIEELIRISEGGLSDAQIARQKEAERIEKEKQEEEKLLQTTPGTPQFYKSKFKQIVGISQDSEVLQMSVSLNTPAEARQSIRKINQIQRELKALKREITATIRSIRSSAKTEITTAQARDSTRFWFDSSSGATYRERAMIREELRLKMLHSIEPYKSINGIIDSAILSFDKAKVEINQRLEEGIQAST